MDRQAIARASAFIRALPDDCDMPDVGVDPDGAVTLDWMVSRHRHAIQSASTGSSDRLAYAWIDGTDRGSAVAKFDRRRRASAADAGRLGCDERRPTMLLSGLPEHVANIEPLSRFLTSDSQFNNVMPKASAFMPGPVDAKTSVFRQGSRPAVHTLGNR